MTSLERFFIGVMLSVAAVSYYSAPFDAISRIAVVPAALAGVLYPAFATSYMHDPNRMAVLLGRGVKYVFVAVFPLALLIMTFAPEILRLWLGPDFAAQSSALLRWTTAGVFLSALAQIPFVLVQAVGRPDLTAKFHLLELPLYIGASWWLINTGGITGAALAWTLRVALDTALLFWAANRFVPDEHRHLSRIAGATTAGMILLAAALVPVAIESKLVFAAAVLVAFALTVWFVLLVPEKEAFLRNPARAASS